MGYKRYRRKLKRYRKQLKRVGTAIVTGGWSEIAGPAREGLKEITGVNAMEDATEEQRRQYEENKAKALADEQALADKTAADEKAATDAAYASLESERKKRARMRGRSSTILTGSLGTPDSNVLRRTLLGG